MSNKMFRLAVTDIDQAFAQGEFRLVFQPKIDLATCRMTGAEAFIRWQHPQFGLLPPGLFLDFIEAAGRIEALTDFVFNEALAAAAAWHKKGRDWSISINVAPGIATAPAFPRELASLLDAYRFNPAMVTIEIPERAVAQEPDQICSALNDIRTLGVHMALDGGGIVPVDLDEFNPMPFTAIKVAGPASIRLVQRLGPQGRGALATRLRQALDPEACFQRRVAGLGWSLGPGRCFRQCANSASTHPSPSAFNECRREHKTCRADRGSPGTLACRHRARDRNRENASYRPQPAYLASQAGVRPVRTPV
jgi:EAL domain-containing protein (putative c-di-GMP-specific phosphodiesterase class I)